MILDSFTERLIHIITEFDGVDIRADFRKQQIRNLLVESFPELDIDQLTEELYKAIYEG